MNRRLLRVILGSLAFIGAAMGWKHYDDRPLLRVRLKDGTEVRVLKIAYGQGWNREHELRPSPPWKRRLWLALPSGWRRHFNPPDSIFDPIIFEEPMISVWWVFDPPDRSDPPRRNLVQVASNEDFDFNQYFLAPGTPDRLTFHRPRDLSGPLPVHMKLNGGNVDFTLPIPELTVARPVVSTATHLRSRVR